MTAQESMKKIFCLTIPFFVFCSFICANAHISTQAHQEAVTMVVSAKDGSVFTAGKDGFIIKWTTDGLGEHYQITELEIRLIALHPNGNDIAVYETDGFSIHRISVWNWGTLTRRFIKNFTNSVTALSYTARGSLLAVGTATVNGAVYLNSMTGRTVPKIKDATGIVNMIVGSASEKSAVMYSPVGHLSYYDMTKGTRKQRFSTETQLEQTFLFNNNLFLAGVKNGYIYVIDALSGSTVSKISANSPVILKTFEDSDLYYIETNGMSCMLKSVTAQYTEKNKISVGKPATVKIFSGLANASNITCSTKSNKKIILGTQGGDIFTGNLAVEDSSTALQMLTEKMYEKVLDIATIGSDFYCLTPKSLFKTSYDTGMVDTVGENNGFTDMICHDNSLILWSKGSRKPVSVMDLQTGKTSSIFTPKNNIHMLRLFNDKIVYIENNTTVNLFDLSSKKNVELYSGTGIQDAILYKETELFVAKSAASNPRSPLISVDTATKETVMLPVNGNVAFSLSYDGSTNLVYGISVSSNADDSDTMVFSYNPAQKKSTSIMKTAQEDTDAFLLQKESTLYTNIGKNQIRSYDTKSRRQIQMNRSASLPLKLAKAGSRVAVLNRDGSISWYTAGNANVLADWYMTVDGMWFEF